MPLLDLLVARLAGGPFAVHGIAAGLHVSIDLGGPREREADLLGRAEAHGLALGDLRGHWHVPRHHPKGIIVGYGTPADAMYTAAIDALARVLRTAPRTAR